MLALPFHPLFHCPSFSWPCHAPVAVSLVVSWPFRGCFVWFFYFGGFMFLLPLHNIFLLTDSCCCCCCCCFVFLLPFRCRFILAVPCLCCRLFHRIFLFFYWRFHVPAAVSLSLLCRFIFAVGSTVHRPHSRRETGQSRRLSFEAHQRVFGRALHCSRGGVPVGGPGAKGGTGEGGGGTGDIVLSLCVRVFFCT